LRRDRDVNPIKLSLQQFVFTPNHVFTPGNYPVEELPDSAFEMGLVGVRFT
jgi:hypothetical protein